MKKIISLFLVLLMIVSFPVSAYAEEENSEGTTQVTDVSDPEESTNPEETTNPEEPENPVPDHTHAAGDTKKTVITPATCETDGEKKIETLCSECGKVMDELTTTETIPATGHDWQVTEEAVAATCESPGKTAVETCKNDVSHVRGGEEITATGHKFTKKSYASTEENDAYDLYTCEICQQEYEYITEHNWDEGTIAKEATCTEDGKKVYTCTNCSATMWETIEAKGHTSGAKNVTIIPAQCTEAGEKKIETLCADCGAIIDTETEEISALGHRWSNNSANCSICDTPDGVESFSVSCNKTQYYVGDKWNSVLTLTVTFNNHTATISTKENLLVGNFSTSSAGEKTYYVTYGNVRSDNTVQITVTNPKLTVKTTSGETAYNDYSYVLGDKGVKFKVQSNTGDKIKYAKGTNLSVSLSNGVYTVKPSKYFTINEKNYKNYYVTFYFERNGQKYSVKLYFSCGIVGLKCKTAASIYTQGANVSKTLSFTQTYIDGTTAKFSVKKKLPTSSVGKKSISYSYYGEKASYTYYVKCKTPSLKASAKSKAVSLSWNKISGATGYKIYRSTSKNGKYTAIKTISKGSTTSYKNTGLKSKKTYYYKIVAVYSRNSKCNSSYSAIRSCKTK